MRAKEIIEEVIRLVGLLCFAAIWYGLKAIRTISNKYYKLSDWLKAK